MKLVFLTQDSEIESLVEFISGVEVVVTDTLDKLESEIEDERCIFFIDLDFDKKYAEKVNQELFAHENIRRVIISSGMRLKDLKKHQKGKFSAHGYLLKPLTLEIINGVLNDYELSDYLLDHQLEGEDVDLDEVDLTSFSGANPKIKEFGFNPEVKAELDKHSSNNVDDFDSSANKIIQAKFDDVFENSDDGLAEDLEFDDTTEDESDFASDSISLPDFPDEVDDIPTLEINLDSSSDEDLTAGFKSGLSPEDGTGEFEIDTKLLNDDDTNISDESQEAAMASNDDLDLDNEKLEFDNEIELDEGALEFDGPQSNDETEEALELNNNNSVELDSDSDDMSIEFGSDDLELGEQDHIRVDESEVKTGIEATEQIDLNDGELEFDESSEVGDIDFGSGNTDLNDEVVEEVEQNSSDLDFDASTNPTVVATSSNMEASALNLDDEDMAEFSGQTPMGEDDTSTDSNHFDLAADDALDDGFSLSETSEESTSGDFSFDMGKPDLVPEEDDLTKETVIADSNELSFGEDEPEDDTDSSSVSAVVSQSYEDPLPKGQMLGSLGQPELLRLQATIKQLREERSGMTQQMDDLKSRVRLVEQDKLTLKAELEEAKIEINILKKRHIEENEETKHRNNVLEERKAFFEEKARTLQKEFDRLSQKIRIDFNKVKQREKELESQLELVTMDTQSQVKSRDMKILELKRKIDSLEFNMENATIREQKSREDKIKLEEHLAKIMKTLRGSIKLLEDDIDLDEETRIHIEKARKL